MTFRRLLLIFPAYLLGIFLAGWWESHTVRINYLYMSALNDVRQIRLQLAYIEENFGRTTLSTSVIDQWLDDSLPANDPAWRLLVERQRVDPWGNPYRSLNLALDDSSLFAIGIYSTGEDGASLTQGNDPDDLNSWDEHTGSHYRAAISEENRKRYAVQGLFLTAFIYPAIVAFGFVAKWLYRRETCQPRNCDNH
ncbi:MAG: hypothetical protein WD894_18585 [Pirellulales bacterium]